MVKAMPSAKAMEAAERESITALRISAIGAVAKRGALKQ
jgi:hypothetical protein